MKKVLFFLILTLLHLSCQAQDLLVSPKRIAFDGTAVRSQNVELTNSGNETATYTVSFVQMTIDENGNYTPVEAPVDGQQFASPYLRTFPRSVTLQPGETQTVKIQLTKTNELKTGEYRSHLYFRAVPKTKTLGETKPEEAEGFALKLTPIFGITIPNTITMGEPDVAITLSDLKFEQKNNLPELSLAFNRSGTTSSLGDITVTHIAPNGTETVVGKAVNFAVYAPGKIRRFTLNLNTVVKSSSDIKSKTNKKLSSSNKNEIEQTVDYSTGKLQIIYKENDKNKGKDKVIAQAVLQL
jgi:hypothetical protein